MPETLANNDAKTTRKELENPLPPILVVDDDEGIHNVYELVLGERDYPVVPAHSAAEALEVLDRQVCSLMLADLCLPDKTGMELIQTVRQRFPNLPIIVITGHGSIESAVQAMRHDAHDYLTKPFLPDELLVSVERALAFSDLASQNEYLRSALADPSSEGDFILGTSPAMHSLHEAIRAVAPTPATVLIRGESGTGKEMVANEIHRLSNRADQPFIKMNCAAIPEHLLEDELFGHEKGAYTGAASMRKGKFESADKGTILLDEIGEMAPLLQVKLLRLLQEKRFHRLGSNKDIECDVRIICATNTDLEEAVSTGRFREDLYYRLNVVELSVPPLRERRDDIPVLAEGMLRRLCVQHAVPRHTLSPEAQQLLCAADFPGNVRELRNVLEHAMIFNRGKTIRPEDFPPRFRESVDPENLMPQTERPQPSIKKPDTSMTLEEAELLFIQQTLEAQDGNIVQTAKTLAISRSTLYSKLKKLGG